ncbi:UNVERIFIED_CONTAM: hypothetical protein K2H54_027521 [Gekko kuhli]
MMLGLKLYKQKKHYKHILSPVTSSNYIFFKFFVLKQNQRERERERTQNNSTFPSQNNPSFLLKDCGWINRLFAVETNRKVPLISDHQEPWSPLLKAYETQFKSSLLFLFRKFGLNCQVRACADICSCCNRTVQLHVRLAAIFNHQSFSVEANPSIANPLISLVIYIGHSLLSNIHDTVG